MRREQLDRLIESARHGNASSRERLSTVLPGQCSASPSASCTATTLLPEIYLDHARRQTGAFADRVSFLAFTSRVMGRRRASCCGAFFWSSSRRHR